MVNLADGDGEPLAQAALGLRVLTRPLGLGSSVAKMVPRNWATT
jgi:hypothetical protein